VYQITHLLGWLVTIVFVLETVDSRASTENTILYTRVSPGYLHFLCDKNQLKDMVPKAAFSITAIET